MKKFIIPLALMLLLVSTAFSGQYEFRVLAVKGNAQYYTGKGSWKNLYTGTKIFKNYKIKLGDKSYLGLIYKSGQTLELKEKGKWKATELVSRIQKKTTSISSKLTDYVVNQLTQEDEGDFDYREGMETTGAIERSLNFNSNGSPTAFVQLNTPRKMNFTTNKATFIWQKVKDKNEYIFTITDRFDRIVHSQIVSGNSYVVNADELNLKRDEYYFWHVACNDDRTIKSPDAAFSFLSKDAADKIYKEFEQLKNELGNENSALNQIVFGNFFEKNYLFADALKHYKRAVELEPSVQEYQNIYTNFLKRANF